MPRLFTVFITSFVLLVTCYLLPVNAETPLERAQNDYSFQLTKHTESYNTYVTNRQRYLSFKTATAKNDSFVKTKEYLDHTDKLFSAYISLVKEYGNSFQWDSLGLLKEPTYKNLDDQIRFITSHQQKLEGAKNLEDLPPLALELKKQLPQIEGATYKARATFEVAQTKATQEEFILLTQTLDKKIQEKQQAQSNPSLLSNWTSEVQNITESTNATLTKTQGQLAALPQTADKGSAENIIKQLQNIKNELTKTKSLVIEAAQFL